MSQNVENKVVEFQFNNKDFEKNVSQSMSTLDKLKNALNFDSALKGFDDLDRATKNFDLSSMDKSVDETSNKFSALEVMALGALMRIGQQAVDAGARIVKAFTIDQVAAGFDKYSEKVQAVATMYATGKYTMQEIEDSLSNLNDYTDRTSYSFSTLVDNMSKFTAAGVELKDAELSMEGIGNWAALSGITAASGKVNIMAYNLSQAMSTGALLLQDFKSIENVNAATEDFKKNLIDAGLAMGTLTREGEKVVVTGTDMEVTYTNLRNTLQKRWVNDKVMLYTFQQYADATTDIGKRALAAAAEARTFEDALGAVNDAVSTSWMKTEEMIFGDYKEATKFWTGLQDYVLALFDKTMTARNELLKGALQNNSWKELDKTFESLNTSSKTFEERIKDLARENDIAIDALIKKYGSLEEVLKTGIFNSSFFADVVDNYTNEIIRSAMAIDVEEGALSDYERTVRAVMRGEYGDFLEARQALNAEFDNANDILEEANRRMSDHAYGLETVTDAQLEAIGVTRDQYRGLKILSRLLRTNGTDFQEWGDNMDKISGRQLLIDSLYNVLEGLVDIVERVADAWKKIFPPLTSEALYNALVSFEALTDKMHIGMVTGANLTRTFEGLFAIVDIIRIMVTDVFSVAIDLIRELFGGAGDSVLKFTGDLGQSIVGIRDWIKENDPFLTILKSIAEVIKGVVGWVRNLIDSFLELPQVQEALGWIATQAGIIKDKFVKWAESAEPIQNGFKWIADTATAAYTAVKTLIEEFFAIPAVQEFMEKFHSKVTNIWGSITDFFTNNKLVQSIKDVIDNFDGFNKIDLSGVKSGVIDILEKVKGALSGLWDSLKEVAEKAGPIFQQIGEWIKTFIGNIGDMWNSLKEFVGEHLGSIIAFVLTGGFAIGLLKIANAVLNITRALEGFGGMMRGLGKALAGWGMGQALSGVGDIFNGIAAMLAAITAMCILTTPEELEHSAKILAMLVGLVGIIALVIGAMDLIGTLSTNKTNKAANASTDPKKMFSGVEDLMSSWLQIAGSMVLLTQALKTIADIKKEDVTRAMIVFTLILAEFVGASYAIKGLEGGFKTGSLSFIAFAASIFILAGALAKISKLPVEDLLKGFIALTMIVIEIVNLSLASSAMSWGSAASILAIGITLEVIADVMKKIAKMEWEDIFKSLVVIVLVFDKLKEVMFSMSLMNLFFGSGGVDNTGLILLEMAGALVLIAAAMKIIADVPIGAIITGGIVFSTFIGEFIGAIAVLKYLDKGSGSAGGAAGTILAIGVSLVAMAAAMKLMANIPLGDIAKGVLALDALMAGIMGVVWASRGANNAMTTILAMAGAIAVLAVAIAALSFIEPERLVAATLAIDSVMVAMAVFVAATGKAGDTKKTAIILGELLVALAGVAGVMLMLGDMNPEDAIARAGGLSLLMVALSGAVYIMSQAGEVTKTAIGAAAALSGLMVALAFAISILQDMKPVNAIANAVALGVLVNAMAIAVVILGEAEAPSGRALLAMGALTLVVAGLAAILGLMDHFNVTASIETATALSILLIAMAVVTDILSAVGPVAGMAVMGAVALDGVIVAILALFGTLGLLEQWTKGGLSSVIQAGIDLLNLVITGIAKIFANVVVTVLTTITAALPEIGTNLSNFSDNVQPFAKGIKNIDEDAVKGVKNLAEIILLIGVGEIIKSIADLVTGGDSIVKFGQQICQLAPYLMIFGLAMKGVSIDNSAIEAFKGLAELILIIAAADVVQSLTGWITGGTSIEDFCADIVPLGEAMQKYSAAILKDGGINNTAVKASAEGAKALAEVADAMVSEGGILQKIVGEKMDLKDFGETIVPFGEAMVAYSKAVSEEGAIDADAIENSTKAAQAMVDLADQMQTRDGILQKFTGQKESLQQFGTDMEAFAESIVLVANTEGLDSVSVVPFYKMKQAGLALAGVAEAIPVNGTFMSWLDDITGGTGHDLGAFGGTLKPFAEGLTQFNTDCADIDPSVITRITDACYGFVDLSSAVQDTSFDYGMNGLITYISPLGNAIDQFDGYTSDISVMHLNQVITALKYLGQFFGDISGLSSDGTKALTEGVNNLAKASLEGFIESWREGFDDVKSTGQDMMLVYGEGAELKKDDLKKIFERIIADCLATFKDYIDQFKAAGYQTSEATETGAESNATEVEEAIEDPVDEALQHIEEQDGPFEQAARENAEATERGYSGEQSEVETAAVEGTDSAVTKLKTYIPKFQKTAEDLSDAYGNNLNGPGSDQLNSEFVKPVKDLPPLINQEAPKIKASTEEISKYYAAGLLDGSIVVDKSILGPIADVIPKIKLEGPAMEEAMGVIASAMQAGLDSGDLDLSKLLSNLDPSVIKNLGWYDAGEYVSLGLNRGIKAKAYLVEQTVMAMGRNAINKLHYVLEEQSPSKATEEAGIFFDLGLVNGILKTAGKVDNAVTDVGGLAVNRMESMLDGLDSDVDLNPVITPVMDLTNIQNGVWSMNSMLADQTYQLNGSMDLASMTGASMKTNQVDLTQQALNQLQDAINKLSGNPARINNNTFNIQGDDPEEIALEVSRILQNDVERTGAVWA